MNVREQWLKVRSVPWEIWQPWLALGVLWLAYELPEAVQNGGFKWRSIRGSGDLLAVLTLVAVSHRFGWARFVRIVATSYAVLLALFRVDRVVFRFIINEDPVLYDQAFMVRHLFVLLRDLWNAQIALAVFGVLGLISLLVWVAWFVIRKAAPLLSAQRIERTYAVMFAAWLIALPASVTDSLGITKLPLVTWLSPKLAANVQLSLDTRRGVERGLADSSYVAYDRIKLARKPSVLIYVVESYGRRIWERPDMRNQHQALLKALEERLTAAGVQSASAFSASSVRGARSWLADATLMLGAPMRYEGVYRSIYDRIPQRPNLAKFFHSQGYETVFVAPADRARAGLSVDNLYGYDRLLDYRALGYKGPHIGWGLVPDQYSIGFVEDHVLRPAKKPVFMNVHLVASHAPWQQIPVKVADYHELQQQSNAALPKGDTSEKEALWRLRFFTREGRGMQLKPLRAQLLQGYLAGIAYDLDLIVEQMERMVDHDSLVVLIGDHQPPLIGALDGSYDSPIHVLSRDPALLAEFKRQGFRPGLRMDQYRESTMGHGGVFSLLARTLARCCGGNVNLPPFLKQGSSLTK